MLSKGKYLKSKALVFLQYRNILFQSNSKKQVQAFFTSRLSYCSYQVVLSSPKSLRLIQNNAAKETRKEN